MENETDNLNEYKVEVADAISDCNNNIAECERRLDDLEDFDDLWRELEGNFLRAVDDWASSEDLMSEADIENLIDQHDVHRKVENIECDVNDLDINLTDLSEAVDMTNEDLTKANGRLDDYHARIAVLEELVRELRKPWWKRTRIYKYLTRNNVK